MIQSEVGFWSLVLQRCNHFAFYDDSEMCILLLASDLPATRPYDRGNMFVGICNYRQVESDYKFSHLLAYNLKSLFKS